MISQRWPVRLMCGAVAAALCGCAVYPLPLQQPYSTGSEVNSVNYGAPPAVGYASPYPVYGSASYSGYGQVNAHGAPYGALSWPSPVGWHGGGNGNHWAQADSQGQVMDVRPIQARSNPTASAALGTAIGGLIGGAVGNAHGHRGWRANNTVAGVMVGALLGSAIGTAASYGTVQTVGYRVTARMDSGQLRTIDYVQAPNVRVGDRVSFDGRQFYR